MVAIDPVDHHIGIERRLPPFTARVVARALHKEPWKPAPCRVELLPGAGTTADGSKPRAGGEAGGHQGAGQVGDQPPLLPHPFGAEIEVDLQARRVAHHYGAPVPPLSIVGGLRSVSARTKLLRNGFDIVPNVDTDRRKGDIVAPKCSSQTAENVTDVYTGCRDAGVHRRGVLDLSTWLEGQPSATLDRVLYRARRPAAAWTDAFIRSGQLVDDLEHTVAIRLGQQETPLRPSLGIADDGKELGLEPDAAEALSFAGVRKRVEPRAMSRLIH